VRKSEERQSVCFDKAADYYDETRSLPAEGREEVLDILRTELAHRGRCLDIGVGTGRTALPLAAAGVPIVGLDLSIRMMLKAVEKGGGRHPFPLVAGDATTLPFRDGAFGAATIIHVFHSIPNWREAIAGAARVVRPGGLVIVDPGNGRTELLDDIEARFKSELPEEPPPQRWTVDDLDDAFAGHGCVVRLLPPVTLRYSRTPADFLASFERGVASWQWSMNPATFAPAAARVQVWAERQFGSLDTPRRLSTVVQMRQYQVPGMQTPDWS